MSEYADSQDSLPEVDQEPAGAAEPGAAELDQAGGVASDDDDDGFSLYDLLSSADETSSGEPADAPQSDAPTLASINPQVAAQLSESFPETAQAIDAVLGASHKQMQYVLSEVRNLLIPVIDQVTPIALTEKASRGSSEISQVMRSPGFAKYVQSNPAASAALKVARREGSAKILRSIVDGYQATKPAVSKSPTGGRNGLPPPANRSSNPKPSASPPISEKDIEKFLQEQMAISTIQSRQ